MKICNLASGSKGNATIVIGEFTSILIDNGLSVRELKKRLQEQDIDMSTISAIIVTHEHVDHIKGVDALSSKLGIPVYIQPQSLLAARLKFGAFLHAVEYDFVYPIEFEDISISAFRINHDATYTQGFRITDGDKIFTYVTDIGQITKNILSTLASSDYTLIESNYDEDMLYKGDYPQQLKSRIVSKNGHLSNEECARTIVNLFNNFKRTRFMLGHMSHNNNTIEKVKETLSKNFKENNIDESLLDIRFAYQDKSEGIIEI